MIPQLPSTLAAMNYVEIIRGASLIELFVLALLVGVSIASWALIAMKYSQLARARAQSLTFLDVFWKANRLESIYQSAQGLTASPLSKVFCAGYDELSKLAQHKDGPEGAMSEKLGGIENVERALNRAATAQITELESRVSFLGTVAGAAPFVGLFGTVVGILNAFNEIADKGNASLSTVAAPVGQRALRHRGRPLRRHPRRGRVQRVRQPHQGVRHRDEQLLRGLPQHREAALLPLGQRAQPWA
jgi:biopolymer transport protein TolQ